MQLENHLLGFMGGQFSKKSGNPVYANAFRAQRMKAFLSLADAVLARKGACRILDVGGEIAYWRGLENVWRPRNLDITAVNLVEDHSSTDAKLQQIAGDARDLRRFADNSFDIVHSNSVIEHVGMWADMQSMAREVRRLAPTYFVQTPNFWFPQEPHLRVPFIHWLPHPWRRKIVMSRPCGFYPRAATVAEAHKILADANLLDAAGMTALFPDAEIVRERVGPMTKSFIAVRDAGRRPA